MTVGEFDKYLDELLDKMGSDYFPLPIKYNRFVSLTLGFIRENTRFLQISQEISEDIQPLFTREYVVVNDSDSDSVKFINKPSNLFRLGSIKIFRETTGDILQQSGSFYESPNLHNTKIRKINFIRDGEENAYSMNPFKKATPIYPNLIQFGGFYRIDFGKKPDINYNRALITYVKEPKFGDVSNLNAQIVNLHKVLIERIVLKTADSLRIGTGDETSGMTFEFNKRYSNNDKLT